MQRRAYSHVPEEIRRPLARRGGMAADVGTLRLLLVVCLATVIVRASYVWQPLRSDEGGYLFVARHWDPGGSEFLYGDHHVDRPFLLLLLYRLAALWDFDGAVRVLAVPFVLVAILGLARGGYLAAGSAGARWAAVVAGALLNSPALAADQADGELLAMPFIAWSLALTLQAWHEGPMRVRRHCSLAAGGLAAAACLVKQSLLEGAVFAAVLVAAEKLRRRRLTERSRLLGSGFLAGLAVVGGAAYAWALWHGMAVSQVWTEVVQFRREALEVIWSGHLDAPLTRAWTLVLLGLVSALLPLMWTWIRALVHRGRVATPVEWGLTALLLFGVSAIAAGGSYWAHYLLHLAPAVSVAAGILAAPMTRLAALVRWQAAAAAASAAVAAAGMALVYATDPDVWWQQRTGQWLAASADPADTAVVAYGNPSVLEAADIGTPYPYLWSLPMRTLDPEQDRLHQILNGTDAPEWIIEVSGLNAWDIDADGRLRELVEQRYRHVADVCGRPVLLRSDVNRQLALLPRC